MTTAESARENSFFSMKLLPVISISMCTLAEFLYLCAHKLNLNKMKLNPLIFVLLPMFLVDAINFLGTTPGVGGGGGYFKNFSLVRGTCCWDPGTLSLHQS